MSTRPIRDHLLALARTAEAVAEHHLSEVVEVAELTRRTLEEGGTLFFCGNGGSAADAQHLAAEYVVRYRRERGALPAVALTVDTSILTAAGNDFGFESVFARQVEALCRQGDLLFLHSTSGQSPNLLRAADAARARGVVTVGFLARDGGPLKDRVDHAIVVPTDVTAHAQEIHLALGHAICDRVDEAWPSGPTAAATGAETSGHPTEETGGGVPGTLARLRRTEKAQTLWYRALAARAEADGDALTSERLNGLHADEQHHLSRLTARLLELGASLGDLGDVETPALPDGGWEEEARRRELQEVAAYEGALTSGPDPDTREVLEEILASEREHARALGGKWMPA